MIIQPYTNCIHMPYPVQVQFKPRSKGHPYHKTKRYNMDIDIDIIWQRPSKYGESFSTFDTVIERYLLHFSSHSCDLHSSLILSWKKIFTARQPLCINPKWKILILLRSYTCLYVLHVSWMMHDKDSSHLLNKLIWL